MSEKNIITGNEPAFPRDEVYHGHNGISIRQHFALHLSGDFSEWSADTVLKALGLPDNHLAGKSSEESFKEWIRLEAKYKVMKADALIAELNKETELQNG